MLPLPLDPMPEEPEVDGRPPDDEPVPGIMRPEPPPTEEPVSDPVVPAEGLVLEPEPPIVLPAPDPEPVLPDPIVLEPELDPEPIVPALLLVPLPLVDGEVEGDTAVEPVRLFWSPLEPVLSPPA